MSADDSKPEVPDLMKNLRESIDQARTRSRELRDHQATWLRSARTGRDPVHETQIPSKTEDQHFGAVDGLAWMNLRDRAWAMLARTSLPETHDRRTPVEWHAHPRTYALMKRVPMAPAAGVEVRPPSTVDTGIRLYLFGIRVIESAQVEELALVIPT